MEKKLILAVVITALGNTQSAIAQHPIPAVDATRELMPRDRAHLPTRLIISGGKPRWKHSADRYTLLSYDGELLTREFGPHRKATYVYNWEHRLVGILYDDGASVTATYGEHGELVSLISCSREVVTFNYPAGLPIVKVSPNSVRAAEFHDALARLETSPPTAPAMVPYRTGRSTDNVAAENAAQRFLQ